MRKYSKDEILEYFNIIGADKEDIKLDLEKGLRVEYFDNLYKRSKASKNLPSSSLEVSRAYELILAIIDNDLLYPTKEGKRNAKKAILEVLRDTLELQEFSKFNPDDVFEKTNRLIRTVLLGMAEFESIPRFRLVKDNMSPTHAYRIITENKDLANEITKLYGIVGLSKYRNFRIDESIYDNENNVSKEKITNLLRGYIEAKCPLKFTSYKVDDSSFERMSYKQLVKMKDYLK